MSYKSCFSFLLLACAVLCFGASDAHACSCVAPLPVQDAYEKADNIIITKVVSVEKSEKAAPEGRMSDGENYVAGIKSTRVIVERVFKGSLKAGDEITFAQGGGGDCIWTFSEKAIGEQFLFYLSPREKNPAIWHAFICGRSGHLKHVADDVLYLNKLEKVRGKSRLSGMMAFDGGEELSVEDRRIRITGAGKTYEVKTDRNGVYEIYDLPAGQYLVEFEVPRGWKLSDYYRGEADSSGVEREGGAAKKIFVSIQDKKHTEFDINFEIDNAVSGTVYDPQGRRMRDVCVSLAHAQGETSHYFYKADCTDAAGRFKIKEIPRGSYLLVINKDGRISSSEPFKTFYHPGVFERERATVLTIGAGEMIEGFDVRTPNVEETITVEGVLLYSDGKPASAEHVEFKATKTKANVENDADTMTDANGRFSLKILKGLEGELYGEMYTYLGEFEKCPKLEAIIKKTGERSANLTTPVVKIQATDDLSGVELKYSFPGCKKAPSP
jgi:hypothetical protein